MPFLVTEPDHPFSLANLPYGVYSIDGGPKRCCTRLGDSVIDLAAMFADLPDNGASRGVELSVFEQSSLNTFMELGHDIWVAVRDQLQTALADDVPEAAVHAIETVDLHLPIEVADYVDFYASEYHASNLGRLFRPDNPDPLQPNWKHLPVGYHGRSASIVVSGTDIIRPTGQMKPSDADAPVFGPCQQLDIEAEMGFIVGGHNPAGSRIEVAYAEHHIFGAVVFNDWSARDIQAWEYVPLGPNLGKSFASTISPWVVSMLALSEAKVSTPAQDPQPLPYLAMSQPWGLDIDLTVEWNGNLVSSPPYKTMYWSPAQMLAHITVNGAPVRPGDLFASGTVSGPDKDQRGAFIELTWGGAEPVAVGSEMRTFVEDGDEIVINAVANGKNGVRLGFGPAQGRVLPAVM